MDFIKVILPNVSKHPERFFNGLLETFIMTLWSGAISFVLGLIIGIIITVTKKGAILENKPVYQFFDKLINRCYAAFPPDYGNCNWCARCYCASCFWNCAFF